MRQIFKNIYGKIFKEEITPIVKIFFQNLKHAIFGYGIAAFFIFIFQILAGRALGPINYGRYALVDSMGAFLFIFMTLGVSTAAIKYNSEKENELRQQKIISSSYFITLIIIFISTFLFIFFANFLSNFFSVSLIILNYSVIFAICYSLYTLAIDSLCGLHQIKKMATFRALYGFLILSFSALFLFRYNVSFENVILVICFSYLTTFLLITINIRNYISLKIDKIWIKNLLEYGLYMIGGYLSVVFLPILSKIMVNKFLTLYDVGIYNAYYFASLNVAILFNTIFIAVFFPTASKYPQKSLVLKKIKKITPFLFIIGIPALFVIQILVLKFFGQKYPTDYLLMLLFAVSGVMFFIYSLYMWLFYSKGVIQARLVIFLTAIVFIINILLNFYLIPQFLLKGAVMSLIFTYFFGWIYLLVFQKKLID